MSIKKIMHKDRHGAQVSVEFGEGGPAAHLVEQFLGGLGVPPVQGIPQEHPGGPKGTDTVPAWLTPGEFVMNAEATRMFEPQIEEMNNAGREVQREQGGSVPEYKAEGGAIEPPYDYKGDRWGQGALVNPVEDAAIAALKAGASPEDVYSLSGIRASMSPKTQQSPFSSAIDYLKGTDVYKYLEDRSDIVAARSTDKALAYNESEREKLMSGMKEGTLSPEYARAHLTVLEGIANTITSRDERASELSREDAEVARLGAIDRAGRMAEQGFTEEAEELMATTLDTPPSPRTEPDESDFSELLAAGNTARSEEPAPSQDGRAVPKPPAWGKVKDFFAEGLGTVLDKGALSEAATIYLGSRALGYDHDGSLGFVTRRYGNGVENKIAVANKAFGTYTPESIKLYKDTGDLGDLTLIRTMTDENKVEYWTDPKTGAEVTLRVNKDERGREVLLGPDDQPVDTKRFLKASEYKERDEYNQKQIKPIMESKLRKFELDNDMIKGEGAGVFNIPQVSQAMSMYAIQNGFNTSKVNELSDYVFSSIIETRNNPKNKEMSDRDLTNLALQEGIAKQMEGDMFLKPNGKPVEPTVVGEVLDLMNGLPQEPGLRGQMLKTMYQHGYMSRTPDERKRYVKDAGGGTSGYLEYLKQNGYIADRDNWVPAWRQLNGQ